MSSSRILLSGCAAALWAALTCGPAVAQYYPSYPTYPTYPAPGERSYARQPGGGWDPDADDGYAQPLARPQTYRSAPRGADLDDDDPRARPSPRSGRRQGVRSAALPPDADPAYSTALDLDGEVDTREQTRALVNDPIGQAPGTLTINTRSRKLYLSMGGGQAIEYGIGVGRQGFAWKGVATVGRKAFWPGWTPPKEMLQRRPDLPSHMDGGIENPLGARALYLFQGSKDTLFRIHGTNEPDTIGQAVSSGCIRMLNSDVMDLYRRVPKGARVVVL